uniref:Elongation factor Ts, chloroplastic n=2 Tax=Pyropia yezoensis TaxID=2788 RepID=EFTS_PYRYE|nr:elongation factor Ts [Neopyropia yezoensis]Q1XDN9.1 RecName: Full=Elongation factor Ts, chloroplastic; Short=EF-Ts [Neopyropia yezoensis]AGH27573.1 elongation factor Ts [Neopyropia yezoensis]QFZ66909.1 elongation factor Ts [Neopyropia yezoensis]ULU28895.1 elongation factor Ts [Neopyropia yezoensis]WKD83404.1 translation elongation factor Ts [Neopyropia yezoensis]BAE92372.1 elongation factor Ts [Neopyropia yezoensis]
MTLQISAQVVKALRDKTGAGMMDCKKALQANNGNEEKALESLRQKGLASANKKSNRTAIEGLLESYIHTGGRIGVLVEVNCETDFVARRPEFQKLAKDIAMQIAASPNVEYVSTQDIPSEIINLEQRVEAGKDDLKNKPVDRIETIIEGRMKKRLKELSLLDQMFIRNQDISIEDLINQNIAVLGENIKIRRFVRFLLGGGEENLKVNFADEVADILNKK